MSISPEDVKHIAHLARIEITSEEVQKFTGDLSAILQFVEKLNEVDTSSVSPVRGGTSLTNETREDGAARENIEDKQKHLLGAVPEMQDTWIKVKAIFE